MIFFILHPYPDPFSEVESWSKTAFHKTKKQQTHDRRFFFFWSNHCLGLQQMQRPSSLSILVPFFKIFQFFSNFSNFSKKVDFYINFYKNRIFSSFLLKFNDFYLNLAQISLILLIFIYFLVI
jgi:hypothetical protein